MTMSFRDNLAGQVFGDWTVLGFVPQRHHRPWWRCRCVCGAVRDVNGRNLKKGVSKGCGCKINRLGLNVTKHSLYGLWNALRARCRSPLNPNYPRYGAVGIGICDEWADDFMAFADYMGPRPSQGHTVDRIDVTKGYEPGNVQWATARQQQNNKTSNHVLTVDGESKTIAEWARHLGINPGTLHMRLHQGWSDERAIKTPVSRRPGERGKEDVFTLTHKGITETVEWWSRYLSINEGTIRGRKKRGWSDEKALTAPPKEMEVILTANGKSMNMTAWAKHLGMKKATLHRRISAGWSHERAVNTPVEKEK